MHRISAVLLVLALTVTLIIPAAVQAESANASVIFFMPVGSADNPFVLMAEKGILAASQLHPEIPVARVYPFSVDQIHHYMAFAAGKGHAYIIGVGAYYADAFAKIADQFPNTHFVIIDGKLNKANVKSVVFNDYEGGMLAGAVAGVATQRNHVGFLGAMKDNPAVAEFARGFHDGVKKVNSRSRISVDYIGKTPAAFSDRQAGYDKAAAMYRNGCDVIFPAAGAAAIGSIDAARDKRKFVIGVDGDLDNRGVGYVLTSIMKRLDTAVLNLMRDIAENKLTTHTLEYNTGNEGFTLTSFPYTATTLGRDKLARIHDVLFELKCRHDGSLANRIRKGDSSAAPTSARNSRIEDLRRRLIEHRSRRRH